RKIHLGKCLEQNDWEAIRSDLDKRPIEGINGSASKQEIQDILSKYGILPPLGESKGVVEIWGTGTPLREFLWSEEMADACVYLMENISFEDVRGNNKEVRNTHINIGTGKEISIKALAELIASKVGFTGELLFNTSKPDGTPRKLTDVSKLHGLGWHHKIEIDEGIGMMYEWYAKNQE
ncbi:MAG: NAD-dependent epimerase/dehydratase family protein, partial [Bacteroidota bacterium]